MSPQESAVSVNSGNRANSIDPNGQFLRLTGQFLRDFLLTGENS